MSYCPQIFHSTNIHGVKTQVREISRDVDSIMVDVETLHRMEKDLKKPAPPPLLPKPSLRTCPSPSTSPCEFSVRVSNFNLPALLADENHFNFRTYQNNRLQALDEDL